MRFCYRRSAAALAAIISLSPAAGQNSSYSEHSDEVTAVAELEGISEPEAYQRLYIQKKSLPLLISIQNKPGYIDSEVQTIDGIHKVSIGISSRKAAGVIFTALSMANIPLEIFQFITSSVNPDKLKKLQNQVIQNLSRLKMEAATLIDMRLGKLIIKVRNPLDAISQIALIKNDPRIIVEQQSTFLEPVDQVGGDGTRCTTG